MFEALKPISTFAAKNVPAVFLFVVLLFLMVIGRLELFTVLVLFTRGFWRA